MIDRSAIWHHCRFSAVKDQVTLALTEKRSCLNRPSESVCLRIAALLAISSKDRNKGENPSLSRFGARKSTMTPASISAWLIGKASLWEKLN